MKKPFKYWVLLFELALFIFSLLFSVTYVTNDASEITQFLLLGSATGFLISLITFRYIATTSNLSVLNYVFQFHKEHFAQSSFFNYVLAPFIVSIPEELFFRGFLLNKIGFIASITIFTFIHALRFKDKGITILSIFFYGSVFSYLYIFTGSILTSIAAHYIFTLTRIYWSTHYIKNNPKRFAFISNYKKLTH